MSNNYRTHNTVKASLLADVVRQLLSFFLLSLLDFFFFLFRFLVRTNSSRRSCGAVHGEEEEEKKKSKVDIKSIKIHKSLEGKTSLVQEMEDAKTKT